MSNRNLQNQQSSMKVLASEPDENKESILQITATTQIKSKLSFDPQQNQYRVSNFESPKEQRQLKPEDGEYNEGKWTDEEHKKFLEGLTLYGKNWNKI